MWMSHLTNTMNEERQRVSFFTYRYASKERAHKNFLIFETIYRDADCNVPSPFNIEGDAALVY